MSFSISKPSSTRRPSHAYKIDPNDAESVQAAIDEFRSQLSTESLHRGHDADLRHSRQALVRAGSGEPPPVTAPEKGALAEFTSYVDTMHPVLLPVQFTGLRSTGRACARHDPPRQRSLYGLAWVRRSRTTISIFASCFPPAVAAG